uniref:Cullin-5 n=1 Tax=Strigamia maritima TaxID=126957 RepID=T1J146_STRMM
MQQQLPHRFFLENFKANGTLTSIHEIIVKILKGESYSPADWCNFLQDIHEVSLCNDDGGDELHQILLKDISSSIAEARKRIMIDSSDILSTVKAYVHEWRIFSIASVVLTSAFRPVQKHFDGMENYMSNYNKNMVRFNMMENWKNHILTTDTENRFRSCVMKLIEKERNGKETEVQLVLLIRDSYIDLCTDKYDDLIIYREVFEVDYIKYTKAFYQIHLSEYSAKNNVESYVKFVKSILAKERERGKKYLLSLEALEEIWPDLLVVPYVETILAACAGMIQRNDIDSLQGVYELMLFVPDGVARMIPHFEEFIMCVGLADMVAAAADIVEDSAKYVEQLIELFNRLSKFVKDAFSNEPRFLSSRDKTFRSIVNDTSIFKLELVSKNRTQSESRCPELLAHFCDLLLRKTQLSKKLSSADIDIKLKDALLLLKYVDNKDVFMRYYKSHLTRRLILETSADSEKEGEMVIWLNEIGMPAEYVMKVEQMFRDIKISEDLNQEFKQMQRWTKDTINIRVLNAAAWARPSEKVSVSVPVELEDFISEMEDFYRQKFNGRKLTWHHHMSNGSVILANSMGKFELDVTTFQMAVLFAWNLRPKERISFENLRLATELPDSELRKTIWSLVSIPMTKRSLIVCHPKVKSFAEFMDETQFSMNDEFAVVRNGKVKKRGKINLIGRLQLSTEKSQQVDNEAIVRLREYRLQEAIVCIMKARKSIPTVQLQHELIGILKNMFVPTKRMIKEQIEWLIDHNYMTRDAKDLTVLVYVA